jgi:hypothetical protein
MTFRSRFLLSAFMMGILLAATARPAAAQGLLWHLPETENFSVMYYGKFTQQDISKGNTGVAPPPIVWDREIIISSLSRAKGFYGGKEVDCRWIEISIRTGVFDEDIDTGPAGKRVYKILVPESKIIGKTTDADKIFVSMIPIALDKDGKTQGAKKIGTTSPKRMTAPVLHVYPILSLLTHYHDLKPTGSDNPINVDKPKQQISPDAYKKYTAFRSVESPSSRSENTASLYFSDLVPTKIAKWEVSVVHKSKNSSQGKDEFKPTWKFSTSMTVREITIGNVPAQIPDPKDLK